MNPIIPSTKPTPNVDISAKANLDITLDGWQAVAGVGIIGATIATITALWLKFRG